jgi:WD40 repeat protein
MDLRDGSQAVLVSGHQAAVTCMSASLSSSHGGAVLASASSEDGALRLWEVEDATPHLSPTVEFR